MDCASDERFPSDLMSSRNPTRSERFAADRTALKALPAAPLDLTRVQMVRFNRRSRTPRQDSHPDEQDHGWRGAYNRLKLIPDGPTWQALRADLNRRD